MLVSRIFGDKSRFAVEVLHDPTTSGPHWVIGFFFYWVTNKRMVGYAYEYLSHTLTDMRDAAIHKTGHRTGGSFCALSPAEFIRWWDENLWSKDCPDEETWWDELWDDHRRFRLDFDLSNSPRGKLYLLDCGGVGRLTWYDDENRPAVIIEDNISQFEMILRDAYDYMSALDGFAGYNRYLTDREHRLFTDRTAAGWHSMRARTMRMGGHHRSDAIADHVFLFRSDFGWPQEQAFMLAHLTGREGAADLGVAFPETDGIQVAADRDDLDGAEVHRAWLALGDEDRSRFPAGTIFQPERPSPRRQRLMSGQQHDDTTATPGWFSVQLRMAFMVEGQGCAGLVDYVHLLRAADFDAAFDRALAIGRAKQRTRLCHEHPSILFQFVEVRALNLLGVGELDDAVEIHVEPPVARLKQDWTPLRDEETRAGMVSREFELGLPEP